jgi:hypothetical protein
MPNISVKLSKPVEVFGKCVGAVELKEPTGGLYVKLGEPRILVFNASGSGYWVENAETIGSYLDHLLIHDTGGEVLMSLLNLEDAMAVKEALFSFFADAASRVAARKSMPSSSASAS